jgi:hypothetical protein
MVPLVWRRKLILKPEVESSISYFSFNTLSSRRFQIELDRVNLQCLTLAGGTRLRSRGMVAPLSDQRRRRILSTVSPVSEVHFCLTISAAARYALREGHSEHAFD